MVKKFILLLCFCVCTPLCFAQGKPTGTEIDYFLYYKRLINATDSIQAHKKSVDFDVKSLFAETKKLDAIGYPMIYIGKADEYYKKGKYNESGFLYYLYEMRSNDFSKAGMPYYDIDLNSVVSGDSLNNIQESSYLFLSADVANYRRILQMAINYYTQNPYTYLVKKAKNYKKQPVDKKYFEMIQVLDIKNKKEIEEGRKEMIDRINEYYEAYKPAFEGK